MKKRFGFVSNSSSSSSSSFIITNHSKEDKTLVDFVLETPHLLVDFTEEYNWYSGDAEFTQEKLLADAKRENTNFPAGERVRCIFGDEDGTTIGNVYDYQLHHGGNSKSFSWEFEEFL